MGINKGFYPDIYDGTLTESNVYTVTYYDNYSYNPGSVYAYKTTHLAGGPSAQSGKTKGLVTGSRVRVLPNGDAVKNSLALSVPYYDDFGRVVETISDNRLGSKKDVVYNRYNFSGQVEKTVLVHMQDSSAQQMLTYTFAYDHQGRLLTEKLKLNSENEITLSSLSYNELGEVTARYLHGSNSGSNFNQQVDYAYNVKGWLRTVNTPGTLGRDLFALDLRYNTPENTSTLPATARYNGNISQMRWDTGTPAGYGFAYDRLNRLTASVYADGAAYNANANRFNTSYDYDANGNFTKLTRKLDNIQADNLVYSYLSGGNRLMQVADGTGNALGYRAVTGQYSYDSNGNMAYDPSKGIYVYYNLLNLPRQVQFGANDNMRYTWDANGVKLAKVAEGANAQNNVRTDYSGNFLYENNTLKSIFTPYGRIVPFNNNGSVLYMVEYNLTDHLGNVRVTFTAHANGKPETNQITSYDPFGFITKQDNWYTSSILKNKYLYNGKEIQNDVLSGTSLDWYDYGARMYDPELGRWHVMDAYAEKYFSLNPYQYCANNPILFIDVKGDSLFVNNGILQNKQLSAAFAQFAGTKQGMAYLSKYAAKDQSITVGGKTFSFDKDGAYSKMGVDLTYTAKDMGDGGVWGPTKGNTYSEVNKSGGMDITVTMNTNSAALNQDNVGNTLNSFNERIYNSTGTFFHESFIHGYMDTEDFFDTGKLDNSNISSETKKATTYPAHYQHYQVLLNDVRNGANNTGLWPGAALQGLQQVNKNLNLNRTTENIKYIMWKYNGGKQ